MKLKSKTMIITVKIPIIINSNNENKQHININFVLMLRNESCWHGFNYFFVNKSLSNPNINKMIDER